MGSGIADLLTPEDRQRIDRLLLQSRMVVEGSLAGRHRSPLKGASSEFADHRTYIAGDDPRKIDWKVFGRTDRHYIRRYEDETLLRVYFIVDRSGSMDYGSGKWTKFQYACRLACALGYVVTKARDAAGLVVFGEKMDLNLPPRNAVAQWNNAMRALQEIKASDKTHTAKTLHQVADSIQRRALVVLFSDLYDDADAVTKGLAHFRKQNHDVILFHTLDPMELDFSFKKGGEFIDLETGEKLLADPKALASDYRQAFGEFLSDWRRRCRELKIDYRLANTSADIGNFVKAYLDERKRMSK
jgi:uncharacterized protein (DUF58 family)